MAWGAVAGAAIGVVGSSMASGDAADAAGDAAGVSAAAAKYQADIQKEMYDQTRQDQAPWRYGGENALNRLLQGMGIDTKESYGGPSETREQIYDRLKEQYTSEPPAQSGSSRWVYDANGGWSQDYTPPPSSDFTRFAGNASAGSPESAGGTDFAGLNAAVDAEFAKQQAGGKNQARGKNFGDLAQSFTMADYQEDPGLAFRRQQGEQGLTRAAAASGRLGSGRYLKDAMGYNSGLASQEYGKAYDRFNNDQSTQYNRLSSIAGIGQTANNTLAQAGQNYANQVGNAAMTNGANQGNALLAAGNARSSGYSGVANALGGVDWSKLGGSNMTGYGGGYDSSTGLGNTSVNWGY